MKEIYAIYVEPFYSGLSGLYYFVFVASRKRVVVRYFTREIFTLDLRPVCVCSMGANMLNLGLPDRSFHDLKHGKEFMCSLLLEFEAKHCMDLDRV